MAEANRLHSEQYSELYAALLGKIISGEYAPGDRLVEAELAAAHGVSRTPVREVLLALTKDGLVDRIRNRGARVASFTPDDVEGIYEIRKALEVLSLRTAVRTLRLSDLIELERKLDALNHGDPAKDNRWNQRQAEADVELHRLIISHSGNRRLIAYLDHISLLIHSLRLLGYRNGNHAQRAGIEHAAIVRALLRRDSEMSQRLLADHIEISKRNALDLFFRHGAGAELAQPAELLTT